MRVEVLDAEEIEEKVMMTPGDIVMMLNEMGGMRVQATAPSLGAASVRIQGMRGRYTRFLSDGLPLFGEVGSLGLLQIPPMDLSRVEVIKGVASSLYGAGAMGGVVNLITRRPTTEWQRELVVNRSTRGATDAVTWLGGPLAGHWGASLLAGVHGQEMNDVNADGWSDLPHYARGVVRPRVFWDDGEGRSFFATSGLTVERRRGGTVDGAVLPATGAPYRESLDTLAADGGVVAQTILGERYVATLRGALSHQRHDHVFGEVLEHDRHNTGFVEAAMRGSAARHNWVVGTAVEYEAYRPTEQKRFTYTYLIPGAFAQDDVRLAAWASLSASGRVDHNSQYGTFASPRVALLLRRGGWNSRMSVGTGFYGPSPLTEETEAAGLSRLSIDRPLRAERGRAASFDVSRTTGPATVTATFFVSQVRYPLNVARVTEFVLRNLELPTRNQGLELVATWRQAPISVTGTYAYVHARETVEGVEADVPLTPRHAAGIVAMWEHEGRGRLGVEWYLTGPQRLEDNPYRPTSPAYSVVGLLAERRLWGIRVFINAENLTNVKQTSWDPLIRPDRAVDGRWTVDAWAPLDGRNINGGVRFQF